MYYKPDSYHIDPYRLPSSVYPTIKYNSELFVSLHWDEVASISEPFPPPPGTWVANVHPTMGKTRSGMVMDIPFDPNSSLHYLILYDDGTSSSILAASMPALIPKPVVDILSTLEIWFPPSPLSVTPSATPKLQHHYTKITRRVLNGVTIWWPKAIATSNKVKMLFGSSLPATHSPSCMSVGKQILPTFSPKKCMMVQISNASEILSCAAQAITTSTYTVLLTSLPCLRKQCSTLSCLVLAFSRFSSLTTAFAFRRPSPAFQAPATISYLILHPLFLCRLLWAILWGCSYVVYSYRLSLTLDRLIYLSSLYLSPAHGSAMIIGRNLFGCRLLNKKHLFLTSYYFSFKILKQCF